MNDRSRALLEKLRALPPAEREAVLAELLADGDIRAVEHDPTWAGELERRARAAQGGLTPSISHDELREQVKQALRTTR